MKHRSLTLAAAATVAAPVLAFGSTAPAEANVRPCGFGDHCAQVIGINAGSYLGERDAPYYWANVVAKLYNGYWVEVECWTYGEGARDNPNYHIWDRVSRGSDWGYVNDWYLDTGAVTQQLNQCPA
jgi:hypothetical protein